MPNSHNHGDHCHDEAHDHDHDHATETGSSDNLYPYIDRLNVIALNVEDSAVGEKIIKPWHLRQDEGIVRRRI